MEGSTELYVVLLRPFFVQHLSYVELFNVRKGLFLTNECLLFIKVRIFSQINKVADDHVVPGAGL